MSNDLFGCSNPLRGKHRIKVFLKSRKSGQIYLLADRVIDMSEYYRSVVITQVFVGSDTSLYEFRQRYDVDWSKMEPLVLKAENDTIYHYTVKYWDKREPEEYDNPGIDEKYFVEVP